MDNTHFYDDKVGKVIDGMSHQINRVHQISKEEKQKAFETLQKTLVKVLFPEEMSYLYRLISEKDKNHDTINHLFVDDLLYLCYEKIVIEINNDFIEEFRTQLRDLPSGFCVQGRTIRLLQILLAFT